MYLVKAFRVDLPSPCFRSQPPRRFGDTKHCYQRSHRLPQCISTWNCRISCILTISPTPDRPCYVKSFVLIARGSRFSPVILDNPRNELPGKLTPAKNVVGVQRSVENSALNRRINLRETVERFHYIHAGPWRSSQRGLIKTNVCTGMKRGSPWK